MYEAPQLRRITEQREVAAERPTLAAESVGKISLGESADRSAAPVRPAPPAARP